MVLKLIKFSVTVVLGMVVVAMVFLGRDAGSYVACSTKNIQHTVKQSIPMEFELQRARDMVNQVIPELRANIQTIAREEIEVERLEKEVELAKSDLLIRRQSVASLKDQFEVRQVAYTINGRDLSRNQLAERLSTQFEQYKRAKSIVASKEQLLTTRKKSLSAAQVLLEKTRSRKAGLEQQIEALVAQHRLYKAQAAASGFELDRSQLAKAEKLMADLSGRLETARRVLEKESDYLGDAYLTGGEIPVHVEVRGEQDLIAEIEEQFGHEDECNNCDEDAKIDEFNGVNEEV